MNQSERNKIKRIIKNNVESLKGFTVVSINEELKKKNVSIDNKELSEYIKKLFAADSFGNTKYEAVVCKVNGIYFTVYHNSEDGPVVGEDYFVKESLSIDIIDEPEQKKSPLDIVGFKFKL